MAVSTDRVTWLSDNSYVELCIYVGPSREVGQFGIRVNAVCPGIVSTSRLDDLSEQQWAEIIDAHVPLKRAGTPAEIAGMVAFLCSEQGAWISEQLYRVDGGQLASR